jgi:hypothetical protein
MKINHYMNVSLHVKEMKIKKVWQGVIDVSSRTSAPVAKIIVGHASMSFFFSRNDCQYLARPRDFHCPNYPGVFFLIPLFLLVPDVRILPLW